ncbi:hypothetical protein DKX38_000274 [Salix brachista]|uniref:Wall-associated receptor kinase galacturonan-binding domain-containing protein n=1 Tax=Salix brachista TaxID=2182728 RepID=A0A5N5P051_9ROSI|nr:hypothetical protein DKX38_000274 [Salix brachista]
MTMAYKYFSSPIILLLLPTLFQLARAVAPMAKPGCQDHCGNISIPYPFGTTKDCYLDESFEIVCDETVNPPRVFIRKTNMEVRNIEEGAALSEVRLCPQIVPVGNPVHLYSSFAFSS